MACRTFQSLKKGHIHVLFACHEQPSCFGLFFGQTYVGNVFIVPTHEYAICGCWKINIDHAHAFKMVFEMNSKDEWLTTIMMMQGEMSVWRNIINASKWERNDYDTLICCYFFTHHPKKGPSGNFPLQLSAGSNIRMRPENCQIVSYAPSIAVWFDWFECLLIHWFENAFFSRLELKIGGLSVSTGPKLLKPSHFSWKPSIYLFIYLYNNVILYRI